MANFVVEYQAIKEQSRIPVIGNLARMDEIANGWAKEDLTTAFEAEFKAAQESISANAQTPGALGKKGFIQLNELPIARALNNENAQKIRATIRALRKDDKSYGD